MSKSETLRAVIIYENRTSWTHRVCVFKNLFLHFLPDLVVSPDRLTHSTVTVISFRRDLSKANRYLLTRAE